MQESGLVVGGVFIFRGVGVRDFQILEKVNLKCVRDLDDPNQAFMAEFSFGSILKLSWNFQGEESFIINFHGSGVILGVINHSAMKQLRRV